LGGSRISTEIGNAYRDWLLVLHERAHGNSDLVAYFFRSAFRLLRQGGVSGLIATNTIGQGDTRATGLAVILSRGGAIIRAMKRVPWPGEAAVIVSVVHVLKGIAQLQVLNNRLVARISAYLIVGSFDEEPFRLTSNASKSFAGSKIYGSGFTFDDSGAEKGVSASKADMQQLVKANSRNMDRIKPYIGGEEVNNLPTHDHVRFVIDFDSFPKNRDPELIAWSRMDADERMQAVRSGVVPCDYPDPVAADWPELLGLVESRVKPERDKQKRKAARERWWQYEEKRPGLYGSIRSLQRILVTAQTSPHVSFTFLPNGMVYAHTLIIFALESYLYFGLLQSRAHEIWVRTFAASMKDDQRYIPTDCFQTFPVPLAMDTASKVERLSQGYFSHRAALMIERNEGMTKTYNRFHDRAQTAEDIRRLRELHAAMDRAVLEAYGWHDLAERAEPIFLDETNEDDHTYQGRLFWPAAFRDEVLARLLALNAERHAEEVRLGIAPGMKKKSRDDEDEPEDE
jgi:hypothetical protein